MYDQSRYLVDNDGFGGTKRSSSLSRREGERDDERVVVQCTGKIVRGREEVVSCEVRLLLLP